MSDGVIIITIAVMLAVVLYLLFIRKKKPKREYIPNGLRAEIEHKCYGECIVCTEKNLLEIHHRDGNANNNTVKNLVLLCPKHHAMVHRLK